ncbi:MAG: glycoside hydrolase family 5 protein [candidate division KSB1 bacterium]|nr:glycoside hydrolase family 5 protein [candidate division KSB1 bacterium]
MKGKKIARKLVIVSLLAVGACSRQPSQSTPQSEPSLSPLHTVGRWILNAEGDTVILRGVNIPSLEWNAAGDQIITSLTHAVDKWKINIARIPLSQDRWYGFGPEQSDGGIGYRALVDKLVTLGNRKGCYIWLDLHWNNAGEWGKNIGQHKMPDDLSATFWRDLARLYADHPAVLFGLYNEPHDVDWGTWRNGGIVTEQLQDGALVYHTPGHQALVETIRSVGADNLIIAAGLDWGFDLRGILSGYALTGENIVYDTHPYPWKPKPWDVFFGNVGRIYPIIIGEWGGTVADGHQNYGLEMAAYLRRNAFCWTAWSFHPTAGPQLIKNWNYDPTWFGELVMRELATPVELP